MEASQSASPSRLRRVPSLWDLVFYGIVLIQPIAPVPLYGVEQRFSDGHFLTTILIALFANENPLFSRSERSGPRYLSGMALTLPY